MQDVAEAMAQAKQHPEVIGAAPFVAAQALLARGEDMQGVLVRGIDPAHEGEVTDPGRHQHRGAASLAAGQLCHGAGRGAGEKPGRGGGRTVTLIAPSGQGHPGRCGAARMKQMQVAGVFDSGHYRVRREHGHASLPRCAEGFSP